MRRLWPLLLLLSACPACPEAKLTPAAPLLSITLDGIETNTVGFGDVAVEGRATRALVLTNVGKSVLRINNAAYSGTTGFTHSDLPTELGPGEQVRVLVSFSPADMGAKAGTISLTTNEPRTRARDIALSGNATNPSIRVCAPPLDLVDANCRPGTRFLSYGPTIGNTPLARRIKITASGESSVRITSFTFVNKRMPKCAAGAAEVFSVREESLDLAAGEDFEVEVLFTPPCEGEYEADLSLETSDPRNPSPKVFIGATSDQDCVSRSDTYEPKINYDNKVDILFVIDDSISMSYIQSTVKDYAANFINELTNPQKPMDFQIGVITTDMDKPSRRGQLVSRTVSAGAFTETIRIINQYSLMTAPNPADRGPLRAFQLLMEQVDISGAGTEYGFAAAGAALTAGGTFNYVDDLGTTRAVPGAANISTSPNLAQPNGFLRTDARLVVIILSDEDDNTGNIAQMATYLKTLGGLTGRPGVPAGFKQRVLDNPDTDFQLFAVVDPSATSAPACAEPANWSPGDPPFSAGTGTPVYHAGVSALGQSGRIVALCSQFQQTLKDIAVSISRPQCSFEVLGGVVTVGEEETLCIQGGDCFAAGTYAYTPPSATYPFGQVTIADSACPRQQTTLTFDYTSCLRSLDTDRDSIPDLIDVCPAVGDQDQQDTNSDGVGDACGD